MVDMYIQRKIYTVGSIASIGIVKGHILFIFVIIHHTPTFVSSIVPAMECQEP
jgi:hypothetical protein